jgi:hypothetical protein
VSEEEHDVNEPAREAEETENEEAAPIVQHQVLESSEVAENGVPEVEVKHPTEVEEADPKSKVAKSKVAAAKSVLHQVLESSEEVAEDGIPADEVEKNPPAELNEEVTKEGDKGESEKLPSKEKTQDHPASPTYKLMYPRLNFSGMDRSPPKSNLKKRGKEIQKEEKEKRDNNKRKNSRQNRFEKRRTALFAKQVLERQDEEVDLN